MSKVALWINKESICTYNILDTKNFVGSIYVHSKMSCVWKTCSADGALDFHRWIWPMQFPKVMTGILMSSINLAALQTLGPPIGKAHKLVVLLPHFSILHSVRKSTRLHQHFRGQWFRVFAGRICKNHKAVGYVTASHASRLARNEILCHRIAWMERHQTEITWSISQVYFTGLK